jgi:hypothetical protein
MQEVPGSIPDWDASVSDALCPNAQIKENIFIIYSSRVLCLSYSCRPVIFLSVVVAKRWAILYVFVIKLTKDTRRRVLRWRDYRGRDRRGRDWRGRVWRDFSLFNPNQEKFRFTVPPVVALLNYISSGILWRIFSQTGIFAGFSFITTYYFVVRISEAAMCGEHYIF